VIAYKNNMNKNKQKTDISIEDKMLLIQDLSSRQPYAVKIEHNSGFICTLHNMTTYCLYNVDDIKDIICKIDFFGDQEYIDVKYFKPYLFPLSSMSDEQYNELHDKLIELELKAINDEISPIEAVKFEIDYYLKNHFDYRGLIERGLALDATGKNIY
jgi:hypothetical protein